MSLLSLMTDTVTLQRPTVTSNNTGGTERNTWTDILEATRVPASVQALSAKDLLLNQQRNILITHRIYTAQKLPVTTGDRIYHHEENKYYLVTDFRDMAGRREVYYAEAREIAEGAVPR